MVGGIRSVRAYSKWLGSAVLIALLLGSSYAHAADDHPLRPTDTSSPRATLQDFVETTDDVYRRMREVLEDYGKSDTFYLSHADQQKQIDALREAPKIARLLDVSGIAPVLKDTVTVERILQLKEILDRIDIPAFAEIPDREAMARQPSKRWRLPNTEIDIVLIENGPRAGEYLVSAATIDRLPEFYGRVKDLPYKPGPAQQLAEVYRSISHGASATIYDAFVSSPAGLSYVIPPRWMLNLPDWARARVIGVAIWQWLGLGLGFLVGGMIIFGGNRLARRRANDGQDAVVAGWRALPVPLAIIFVAGLLVPWLDTILRIGGNTRVAITYAATGAVVLGAAWLAVLTSVVIGEAIVGTPENTKPRQPAHQTGHTPGRPCGGHCHPDPRRGRVGISRLLNSRRSRSGRSRCRAGGSKHDRQSHRFFAYHTGEAVSCRPRRQDRNERRDGRGRRLPQHSHPNTGQHAGDDSEQRGREHHGRKPQPPNQASPTILPAAHLRYPARKVGRTGCPHQTAHH